MTDQVRQGTPLTAEEEKRQIKALCVRAQLVRARHAARMAPLGTLFLVWMEQGQVGLSLALTWLVLASLSDSVMVWLTSRLLRYPPPDAELPFWQNWLTGLLTVQGLAWGSAIVFFHVPGDWLNDMVVLLVLTAVSATSVIDMSASFKTQMCFVVATLSLPIVYLLSQGDPFLAKMAFGLMLLLFAVLQFGWKAYRQFYECNRQTVLNRNISQQLELTGAALRGVNDDLAQRNTQLNESLKLIGEMAVRDELTGLYNRRFLMEQLAREMERFVRHGAPCSAVMLDVDHFKQVNDTYGHAVGDEVLRTVSRALEAQVRQGDFVGRYGGEEFVLLLPMTDLESAAALAQRVRAAVEKDTQRAPGSVTASFGVAQLRGGEPVDRWLMRVDEALYRAKAAGRNCVVAV
ncbi:MAG: GGDEF domain-containing protein [Pseudomonadota bacterium]